MADLRKTILSRYPKKFYKGEGRHNFNPVKWSEYFDSEEKVKTNSGLFHVYKKGSKGPVMICLHGGGYSGLTWSLFAVEISTKIECQVIAIDMRGHGNTVTENDNDLSLETLSSDVEDVITALFNGNSPPIVLLGHSMGGAVAVHVASYVSNIAGLCVIDVVEGTALDALSSMQSVLRGRPSMFKSVPHAIQWCYKGGQTNNLMAAKVSMPGQIVNMETKQLAADECDNPDSQVQMDIDPLIQKEPVVSQFTIQEEDDEATSSDSNAHSLSNSTSKPPTGPFKTPVATAADGPKYCWRIDLSKTERFWTGWFTGLSRKFLDAPAPKILLLAHIHCLDTLLTVGQMQGKFQLQVLQKSGHAIHEDQPEGVADVIAGFLVKQKLAVAKDNFTSPMPCC